MSEDFDQVFQFKITLVGIEPAIWRRIQVPGSYSFWDLHTAIQDAMGWLDCHLHHFAVSDPHTGRPCIAGIPEMELFEDEEPTTPGWILQISDFFSITNSRAQYVYDFGDDWQHDVVLEDVLPRENEAEYPRCVGGERACPPEDVGGVPGYEDFLAILTDPEHEQHEELLEWAGGAFDPEAFDPSQVRFDDPTERWQNAFGPREEAGSSEQGLAVDGWEPGPVLGFGSPPFERFSPAEMHGLLHSPFDEKLSPMVLDTQLEDEAFHGATLVVDAARYLQMLRERQPLKLTQRGNLSRRFVQELWTEGVPAEGREWIRGIPMQEMDVAALNTINLLTAKSGLTRKRHGKLLLTRKAEHFLDKKSTGDLFLHLFTYYTSTYNWAYEDLYPESWIVQGGFGYSLYLVQQYGTERLDAAFYAAQFRQGFPAVIGDFSGVSYGTPEDQFARAYALRVLRHFMPRFGLVDLEEEGRTLLDRETYLTATPLLSRLVNWRSSSPES